MSESQVQQLARYRIQQAQDSLREAEILFREQSWRGAINRAYYVMFYAVLALTVVRGFGTSKHTGVLAFFDREFVKPGIFSKLLSRKLHLAFERRQNQDYGEFTLVDEQIAKETLVDATEFVDAVKTYLISPDQPSLNISR